MNLTTDTLANLIMDLVDLKQQIPETCPHLAELIQRSIDAHMAALHALAQDDPDHVGPILF